MKNFDLKEGSTSVYNIFTIWIYNKKKAHKHAQRGSNYQKHTKYHQ